MPNDDCELIWKDSGSGDNSLPDVIVSTSDESSLPFSWTPGNGDGAVPVALRQARNSDWAQRRVRAVPDCTFDLQQAQ